MQRHLYQIQVLSLIVIVCTLISGCSSAVDSKCELKVDRHVTVTVSNGCKYNLTNVWRGYCAKKTSSDNDNDRCVTRHYKGPNTINGSSDPGMKNYMCRPLASDMETKDITQSAPRASGSPTSCTSPKSITFKLLNITGCSCKLYDEFVL